MTDAPCTAETLPQYPAVYSQGFAHVRIVSQIDADDPGPLPLKRTTAVEAIEEPVGPVAAAEAGAHYDILADARAL